MTLDNKVQSSYIWKRGRIQKFKKRGPKLNKIETICITITTLKGRLEGLRAQKRFENTRKKGGAAYGKHDAI